MDNVVERLHQYNGVVNHFMVGTRWGMYLTKESLIVVDEKHECVHWQMGRGQVTKLAATKSRALITSAGLALVACLAVAMLEPDQFAYGWRAALAMLSIAAGAAIVSAVEFSILSISFTEGAQVRLWGVCKRSELKTYATTMNALVHDPNAIPIRSWAPTVTFDWPESNTTPTTLQ